MTTTQAKTTSKVSNAKKAATAKTKYKELVANHTGTLEVTRDNVYMLCEQLLSNGQKVTALEVGKHLKTLKSAKAAVYVDDWKTANIQRLPEASPKRKYEVLQAEYSKLKDELANAMRIIQQLQAQLHSGDDIQLETIFPTPDGTISL
jgi:myosin heavy subunit